MATSKRFLYEMIGRGLNTNRDPGEPGYAAVLKNARVLGPNNVANRGGTMRVWNTRTANDQTVLLFEWVDSGGTTRRVTACNGALESFTLTAGDAKTSLETGLSSSDGIPEAVEANYFAWFTDQRNGNLVSNGQSGAANTVAIGKAAPSAPSLSEAGAASAFTVGTYYVALALNDDVFNMHGVPCAAASITKVNASLGIRFTMPATPGASYTMYIYRTRVGELGPFFRVATSQNWGGAVDLAVTDADIAAAPSSYPESLVHNADGEIVAAVLPACKYVCSHKSRNAYGSSATTGGLRIYFSELNKPGDCFVTSIAQNPAMYHDLTDGQGQRFMGMASFAGTLVCFKDHSITERNGDIPPETWRWNVAVDGYGCAAEWTRAVAPGIGVFFCGASAIYLYSLGGLSGLRNISDRADGTGIGDVYRALDFAYAAKWVGVWDPENEEYHVAVTPSGATVPTVYYSYAPDRDAWTGPHEIAHTGLVTITCAGLLTNAAGLRRVYWGTSNGYAVETGRTTLADGPISGTITGTLTGVSGNHVQDSGASFYTSGDGLTGLVVTIRMSATSYESKLITSNSATQLNVGSAWTGSPTGKTYFVGAIESTFELAQLDFGDPGRKRVIRYVGTHKVQTHTVPMRYGYRKDDDSSLTSSGIENDLRGQGFLASVGERATEFAPRLNIIGTGAAWEVKSLEVWYEPSGTRKAG